MLSSSSSRPFASSAHPKRNICVYDCRSGNNKTTKKWLETEGVDYEDFLRVLTKTFPDCSHKTFVLATTDRTILDPGKFMELEDGSTLYMLQQENQALPVVTEEQIQFVPHYDTLICGGMYEYYASEGQTALSYTLAELIDNALSATAKNKGIRNIEIRMLFDETLGKPAIIVLDNGCGMTSKKLNKWAVYRLSKFKADGSSNGESNHERYVRPDPVPRSLNSDISYFGVGGKQAVFYIGESARMISKSVTSPDVHELVLSKEDFERKVKNKEDVYSGTIINRKPGDFSRVSKEEEHFLRDLIAEETKKESFTAVVITEIKPEHITLLKRDFDVWTRQLAHTYHYYIHGVNGNDLRSSSTNSHDPKIEIEITLQEKITKCPRVLNLREVDNDMQTLYINTAADTFEFKALIQPDGGTVEGVLRYHPYLYDRETYPEDPDAPYAPIEDDDFDEETGVLQTIKKKPIFECFWNGRLIPYTTVAELDWCARPSKGAKVPVECYSRISGVLFTDDRFQVTTNKLTFMELELKLRSKDTIFSCSVNGQRGQRGNIQRDFTQWLQNCHEKWDKQVKFLNYKETIKRTDVPTKKMQHPWAIFGSIEWDSREYRIGQYVKSQKTQPIIYGTVVRFLLHGNYDGDVFATGGLVEVCLEPKALYNKTKIIAISKLDKNASLKAIKANIENELARLPEKLKVDWPDGKPWPQNATRPAGTQFGPLQVEILNGNQESISRMPPVAQGTVIKLIVELKVVQHRPDGDEEVASCVAQYAAKWGYWFKKIANLVKLGKYTLHLRTMISDTNETVFGDRQLPFFTLRFTIKEGSAEKFDLGTVSSSLHVGVPFDIPLKIKDAYGHSTAPLPDVKPVLECSGLDLTYEKVQSNKDVFIIKNVKARGKVLNYQQSKTYDLKVILLGLKEDTKSLNISLLPGNPHSIHVTPEDDPITVENGNSVQFDVAIHDEAGNITAHPELIARCRVPGMTTALIDCSRTGVGQHLTKPIKVKIVEGQPQTLKVKFDVPNHLNIASVTRELKVGPSSRVCRMDICCHNEDTLVLRNNDKIEWLAGGVLENLFYRLYDEGNRKVAITPAIASKIKVNWTSDGNVKDLVEGELPDVHVPTQVHEERFYQVSYQDQSISVSFSIAPRPNEPSRLKATLSQNTASLGEPMSGNIILDLVDQYENITKTLTSTCLKHITVEAEGLNKSALVLTWQESSCSVLVTGVCFQSGTLGPRQISFTFRSYVDQVMVKVTPGVPAQIKLVSGPTQPLQLLNNHGIPTPFLVQLCDKWGNPTGDQRVVVHLKSSPQTLKVTANVTSQPVNAEGKASFSVTSVCGPKGYYQLTFEGSLNSKPLHGPSVNLTLIPDPNKPVSLSVKYDTNAELPAGGVFPVFSVTVVSEEGSPVTTFNKAAASMLLWKGVQSGRTCPPDDIMKCSKPMENEEKHCIHFRDKRIPEQLGEYTIQFSLKVDRGKELQSDPIIINVVANVPVQLRPDVQPATPVVSYSTEVANRTLVDSLTLTIMDQCGNPAGQNLNGNVLVSIKNSNEDYNTSLPLFEGGTSNLQFLLLNGKAHISKLAIMENSPGENGSTYVIRFEPVLHMVLMDLTPFELPFRFYNDSKTKERMSELSKKKDELIRVITAHQDVLDSYYELMNSLTTQYKSACNTEATQREELKRINLNIPHSVSTQTIDRLITEKTKEAEGISRSPRRQCSIQDAFKGQQDVLGKVGHLAWVVEDDAAWVISWCMRSSMDCVITVTTAAAKMIYRHTGGKQQVMALDSVYLPGGIRPLPHIRNGRALFDPPGNPVFARDLLIFPNHRESCDIVFRNLLGETILMDDLDSANTYRRMLVQNRMRPPTIVTRQGDRISAQGIWGGSQNKAPPPQQLPIFGAPLPQQYFSLTAQIELLRRYRSALQNRESAKLKYDKCVREMRSKTEQKQEMEEKMAELKEVEEQLASTPVRPSKRASTDAAGPSGVSKRLRSTSQ